MSRKTKWHESRKGTRGYRGTALINGHIADISTFVDIRNKRGWTYRLSTPNPKNFLHQFYGSLTEAKKQAEKYCNELPEGAGWGYRKGTLKTSRTPKRGNVA